jgi:hypothetical protein
MSNSQGLLYGGCGVLLLGMVWLLVYGLTEIKEQ